MNSIIKYLSEKSTNNILPKIINVIDGATSNIYEVSIDDKKVIVKIRKDKDILSIKKIKLQFDIQKYLYGKFPVPPVMDCCLDTSLTGFPFYVMDYIYGEHKLDKISLIKSYDLLIKLHKMDMSQEFERRIDGFYLENTIKKIFDNYNYINNSGQNIDDIVSWLLERLPKKRFFCLTHNDWKMDNIIFDGDEIVAVLDWEMFDVGDPRLDLAISLAYISDHNDDEWDKVFSDVKLQSDFNKKDIVNYYFKNNNIDVNDWLFFEVLGILRLVSVAQLIDKKSNKYINVDDKINIAINRCKKIIGAN